MNEKLTEKKLYDIGLKRIDNYITKDIILSNGVLNFIVNEDELGNIISVTYIIYDMDQQFCVKIPVHIKEIKDIDTLKKLIKILN